MKILQINKYYYLKGGAERYMLEIEKALKADGHMVVPFSMEDKQNLSSEYLHYFAQKVSVDKFSLKDIIKFFYNYDAVRKLKRMVREQKPDIAHLHNVYHQLSPLIINLLKKEGIPVVMTLHDYKIICPNYKLFVSGKYCEKCKGARYYNCFLNKCLKNSFLKSFMGSLEAYFQKYIARSYEKVDMFIAPSEFMKKKCVEFGFPDEKISVLHNFIIPPKIVFEKSAMSKQRDYFLYYGRLSQEKGIETIIDAIEILDDNNVCLKIVGAGPLERVLRDKINNMGLSSRIELTGPKYGEELADTITGAKAVILPSLWPENMPFTLLESLSAGKTVIGARSGGVPEFIFEGENGYLFEPGNIIELRDKLMQADELDRVKQIEKNKQLINELRIENHLSKLIDIYYQIVNKS